MFNDEKNTDKYRNKKKFYKKNSVFFFDNRKIVSLQSDIKKSNTHFKLFIT